MKKLTRDPSLIQFKREVRMILQNQLRGIDQLDVSRTQYLFETFGDLLRGYQLKLEPSQYETSFEMIAFMVEVAMDAFSFGDNTYGDVDGFFAETSKEFFQVWEWVGEFPPDEKLSLLESFLELVDATFFEERTAYQVELLEIGASLADDAPCQECLLEFCLEFAKSCEEPGLFKLINGLFSQLGKVQEQREFAKAYFEKSESLRRWLFKDALKNKAYQEAVQLAESGLSLAISKDKPVWAKVLKKAQYELETYELYAGWNHQLEKAQERPQSSEADYSEFIFKLIDTAKSPAAMREAARKLVASREVLGEEQAALLIAHMKKTFYKKKAFMTELSKLGEGVADAKVEIKSLF